VPPVRTRISLSRGRDDRLSRADFAARDLAGPLHLGQPAAVGADRDHAPRRKLDKHAPQGVATRFVVGREHRPPDELADQRRRKLIARPFRKRGHAGKLERILDRQPKLAAGRLDAGGGAVAGDLEHGAGRGLSEDRRQPPAGQEHGAGRLGLDPFDSRPDADLKIGGQDHRPLAAGFELDVGEHRLGRTGRHDGRRGLDCGQEGLLGTTNLHAGNWFLRTCFHRSRTCLAGWKSPAGIHPEGLCGRPFNVPENLPFRNAPCPLPTPAFSDVFWEEEGIGKGADPGYEEHLKTLSYLP